MRLSSKLAVVWLGGASLMGCSSPELSGSNFSCTTDEDCGGGQVCRDLNGALACQALIDTPIRIGMSGPLQGPSQDLGNEMRRGINAYLKRVNEGGGVHGRQIELTAVNDNYQPDQAVEATRQLLDVVEVVEDPNQPDVRGPNSVFALVGNIGTPTMLATAPLATKNEVVFFGPFTGSQAYLRDGTNSPFVYNYRAGYFDETAAMVDYLKHGRIPSVIADDETDYQRILVFAQDDSYGDAGYAGVVNAYNQRVAPLPSEDAIARVGYTREQVDSVGPAVQQAATFLEGLVAQADEAGQTTGIVPAAVIMIDTYLPGNRFIREMKDWINEDAARARRLDPLFMHVSFVGSNSLAEALTQTPATYQDIASGDRRSYSSNVMVTQVVPYYGSEAAGVRQYRDDIEDYDNGVFTFTSLEGYIVARLFATAVERNGPNLTTENFIRTLDTQIRDLDLGLGTELTFTPANHQASDTVWGTEIADDGSFTVPFIWRQGGGIQAN